MTNLRAGMRLKKKKSTDATWTQTVVPDAKTQAYAPTVTIKNRWPYLEIVVGAIVVVIAVVTLLGLTLNAQASAGLIIAAIVGIVLIIFGGVQLSRTQA